MWNRTNKHLGEESQGQAEEGAVCPGRCQGSGSARGYETLSPHRETLGEVSYLLWPKVVLLRQYRHTQIKPNLYPGLLHLEKFQQRTGTFA